MHATTGRWKLGLALALVTAACWGLLPIALRIVLDGMDAWTITWYRFAVSGFVLGLFLAWRRRLPLRAPLTRRGWALFAVALAGLLGNYVLYLFSLEHTGPTAAQVLIQLAPVFLLFGGLFVFRERFAPLQWAGFAVLACGLLLFFHDRLAQIFTLQGELGVAVAVMVLAAISWAIYGLAQKQLLTQLASEQVLFLLYACAVPLLLPAAHPAQVLALDPLQFWMLAFCCANTVVAYGCFAEALEHWEVSRVSAVVTIAPLVTLAGMHAASSLWPGSLAAEGLSWLSIGGALLVVTGAMTTAIGARTVSGGREPPSPQPA
jgi:drug/metabolite transporter (DMT)-like permease